MPVSLTASQFLSPALLILLIWHFIPLTNVISCTLLPIGETQRMCKTWSCLTELSLARDKRCKQGGKEEWGLVDTRHVL